MKYQSIFVLDIFQAHLRQLGSGFVSQAPNGKIFTEMVSTIIHGWHYVCLQQWTSVGWRYIRLQQCNGVNLRLLANFCVWNYIVVEILGLWYAWRENSIFRFWHFNSLLIHAKYTSNMAACCDNKVHDVTVPRVYLELDTERKTE